MKGTLFALARNRNDIDANEKLKSMLYQVEATGAAFIDGKNILADSIFARHIQAGSITTEHMTAGSIKGDRIEVGTLNGDRITANTITSNMIHTAGLDAGVIKTGTISAGNGVSVINMANGEFSLAGGKMGYVAATDRLYLGMGTLYMGELPIEEHNRMVGSRQSAEIQKTAIINEKQALDARYASIYNSSSLTGIDLSDKYNNATTGYTARYNSLTTALEAVIEALPNTTIAEFATLQSDVATATGNYTAAVFSLNKALELASKTDISDQIETKSRTFTSTPAVPYNRGDIWKNGTSVYVCSTPRNTGSFLLSEWTLTADKTTVQRINDDPDTQRIEGRKMHFTNEVWMDDAWIDKLVANSIVVTKIQTTELDAGKITTGSLNASLITTGSLNASLITTGNLDAARITTGVISAGNGKSTINMSTGAFSFGSGKIAYDGTTLLLNVDSLKITNSSVATEVYASLAAGTAKTEAISAAATDATSKVNSIEIGGRNLIRTSYIQNRGCSTFAYNSASNTWQCVAPINSGSWGFGFVISSNGQILVDRGRTFMVSLEVKPAVACTWQTDTNNTYVGNVGGNDNDDRALAKTSSRNLLAGVWNKVWFSYTAANNLDLIEANSNWGIVTGASPISFEMRNIQGELGSIPTAWTPAPEDVEKAYTDLAIAKANLAETTAKAHADGIVTAEEQARIAEASAKLAEAKTYADTQVNSIEIGGRNLFLTSGNFGAIVTNWANNSGGLVVDTVEKWNGWNTIRTTVGNGISGNWYKLENGVEYTYSAMIKSSEAFTGSGWSPIHYWAGLNNVSENKIQVISYNTSYETSDIGKYKLLHIVFKLTSDANSFKPFVYFGSGTRVFNIAYLKLEKGNKATDWTPAPEDVAYDIEQKADSAEVAANLNIVSTAAAQAKSIADAKLNKNTYDDFVKEYGEYKTALAVDQSVAAGNLQAAQTAVASIKKEMGDMKESWTFNNGTKIEATPNGMLISDGNPSGMNMLLSQNRLSFFDGGVEVAYIADKTMKINNGIFVKSAQIGSHLISTSPTNSDITIVSFVGQG